MCSDSQAAGEKALGQVQLQFHRVFERSLMSGWVKCVIADLMAFVVDPRRDDGNLSA